MSNIIRTNERINFDRSQIMKVAWLIKKEEKVSFSAAVKAAWFWYKAVNTNTNEVSNINNNVNIDYTRQIENLTICLQRALNGVKQDKLDQIEMRMRNITFAKSNIEKANFNRTFNKEILQNYFRSLDKEDKVKHLLSYNTLVYKNMVDFNSFIEDETTILNNNISWLYRNIEQETVRLILDIIDINVKIKLQNEL